MSLETAFGFCLMWHGCENVVCVPLAFAERVDNFFLRELQTAKECTWRRQAVSRGDVSLLSVSGTPQDFASRGTECTTVSWLSTELGSGYQQPRDGNFSETHRVQKHLLSEVFLS